MKLFKKALLATAIFGAVGANAAVLSSDTIKLSAEGVAAGKSAINKDFEVDFVVKKLTPSASVITLKFDDKVDLSKLEAAAGSTEVTLDNDPSEGTGVVVAANTAGNATLGQTLLTFDYGTGSFTFDRLVVDADEGTITFEVNLGNPVTAESAFRMSATAEAGVDFSGVSNISYSSEESDGTAIETGAAQLTETVSQFGFAVTKEFDGRIERAAQITFAANGEGTVSNPTIDALSYVVQNNEALGAALNVSEVEVVFEGDFDNGEDPADITGLLFVDSATTVAGDPALNPTLSALSLTMTGAEVGTTGAKTPVTITFTGGTTATDGVIIPVTGDITAKAMVTADVGSPFYFASGVSAGQWSLDAVVVNIPYFPVGFDGLSTSVHFANESANDADVIVTAIDQKGNEYSGTMTDLAGDTVTKYTQDKVMDALKAPAGSKLSVTFNINANEGDVKAYAFSNAGTGRQALVTSQQDGK